MKKQIIKLVALLTFLTSLFCTACHSKSELPKRDDSLETDIYLNKDSSIILKYSDTMQDGTPTYNVILPDSSFMEHMTPEEISHFLTDGKWENEK